MEKKLAATVKKKKKKKKSAKRLRVNHRFITFLAGLMFLIVIIPLLIVFLFSQERLVEKEQALEIQEMDIGTPPILVWLKEQDEVVEVELEEYLMCVVSSEMPASFEMEALKAQAVAARTYSVARELNFVETENPTGHEKAALCDTTHCQVYQNKEQIAAFRSAKWMAESWPRIQEAVNATAGQVLCYNGELAGQTLFHSSSGGRTENSEDVFVTAVPYLRSVESPYEEDATHSNELTEIPISQFVETINSSVEGANIGAWDAKNIKVTARSSGDKAMRVEIGSLVMTGKELRELFSLASANFNVSATEDSLLFVSNGYGHGVGLSQYGANGMAKRGYTYDQILTHYYTGVEIKKLRPADSDIAAE